MNAFEEAFVDKGIAIGEKRGEKRGFKNGIKHQSEVTYKKAIEAGLSEEPARKIAYDETVLD